MRLGSGLFALAPMSALFVAITWAVLPIPAVMALAAVMGAPGDAGLLGVALFMSSIYLLVWGYYRPTRFELGRDGLRIVWPWRTRTIPLDRLGAAKILSRQQLRERVGIGMRIGAGGLWGGFGWLRTTRAGTLSMYISRYDVFTLVAVEHDKDLLISPERPEEFVRRLGQLQSS